MRNLGSECSKVEGLGTGFGVQSWGFGDGVRVFKGERKVQRGRQSTYIHG